MPVDQDEELVFADLREELLMEIFTRLPPKSLLRFRSLSKSLYSCIATPDFIRTHTLQSPQKVLITHYSNKEYGMRDFYYTLHSENQLPCLTRGYIDTTPVKFPFSTYPEFVGSCNGIICVVDDDDFVSLWNPSIRRILQLPDSPGTSFDELCRIGVGLGFDSKSNDYKIVSIPTSGGPEGRSYIYTIKTGDWVVISSPTPSFSEVTSRGCFVNGALHWVVRRQITQSNDVIVNYYYILRFDLSTHVFGRIELPEPGWETKRLTTIKGSLAVISTQNGYSWIWVMREYNNAASWYVFFEAKTNLVQGQLHRVLHSMSNGNLLLHTFGDRFHVYDGKKGAPSRLVNLNGEYDIFDMEICIESLQLFDMGTAY